MDLVNNYIYILEIPINIISKLRSFVFDTKPLNLILRGFSWIFKSINLCYNQCIINIENHEFLDADRRVYLHRELYFISKYP